MEDEYNLVSKNVHKYINYITDSLGICRACIYFDKNQKKSISSMICSKTNIKCIKTKINLLQCNDFKGIKKRTSLTTFLNLTYNLIKTIFTFNSKYFKNAINEELKN